MTDPAARLLVVDDEPTVRELLSAALRFTGFAVTSAGTGAEALASLENETPDLVVLDVMLPDLDGFEVVRRLRDRRGSVPVLFLTARDAPDDVVTGLALGGDDYVTKPFNLEELVLRIKAILRRTSGLASETTFVVGDLVVDASAHSVLRAGVQVRLSPTEFRLLHFLVQNADRVMTKGQILDQVWRYDFGGDRSIVDTYVSYLRRKVDTGEPKLIHTVHGVGYVVRTPR